MERLGVLASGGGSNLAAILRADLPVVVVVVDRPCGAVAVAEEAGVPVRVVERGPDRVEFTHRVVDALEAHRAELVAMAGFMTILEKPIFDAFPGRVLNTHPSLLPAFRGARAVADALEAGVKVTGCTIHVATLEVDSGPILAQEAVPVLPGDTAADLHERIKAVEHRLYPDAIREFMAGLRGPNAETGLRGPNAETGLRGPNAEPGLRGPNAEPGLRGPNAEPGLP